MKILKRKYAIQIFIIDYIQLLTTKSRNETREREMAEIARKLKLIAKELNIVVVVLAQLNRESEKRSDRRPAISDIRESDTIAMNSDIVGLLHRPSFYGMETYGSSDTMPTKGTAKLLIQKNRNGQTGDIPLAFVETKAQFTNLDLTVRPEYEQTYDDEDPLLF